MSTRASKAVVLTKEHKAIFPEERKRIEKSGGFVRDSRLQGVNIMLQIVLNLHI